MVILREVLKEGRSSRTLKGVVGNLKKLRRRRAVFFFWLVERSLVRVNYRKASSVDE